MQKKSQTNIATQHKQTNTQTENIARNQRKIYWTHRPNEC